VLLKPKQNEHRPATTSEPPQHLDVPSSVPCALNISSSLVNAYNMLLLFLWHSGRLVFNVVTSCNGWKRPMGRRRSRWMITVHNDVNAHSLK